MALARGKTQDDISKAILPVVDPAMPGKSAEHSGGKEARGFLSPEMAASPLISGSVYCVVSAAMVLLNKYALSGFDFSSPNSLLLLQCVSAVGFVKAAELMGVWRVEKLRWDVVRVRCLAKLFRSSCTTSMRPCRTHHAGVSSAKLRLNCCSFVIFKGYTSFSSLITVPLILHGLATALVPSARGIGRKRTSAVHLT